MENVCYIESPEGYCMTKHGNFESKVHANDKMNRIRLLYFYYIVIIIIF